MPLDERTPRNLHFSCHSFGLANDIVF